MKRALGLLAVVFLLVNCADNIAQNMTHEKETILNLVEKQKEAWNNYNLELFMTHYWNNDSMKFMTKEGVKYGWQTTLENYKSNYPTPEKMGVLDFTVKHLDMLSPTSAYLLGKWELMQDTTLYGGHFSLIWKKINGEWKIVTDHTS